MHQYCLVVPPQTNKLVMIVIWFFFFLFTFCDNVGVFCIVTNQNYSSLRLTHCLYYFFCSLPIIKLILNCIFHPQVKLLNVERMVLIVIVFFLLILVEPNTQTKALSYFHILNLLNVKLSYFEGVRFNLSNLYFQMCCNVCIILKFFCSENAKFDPDYHL